VDPFIRKEEKLAVFIDQEQSDFLVIFPSWYSELRDELIPVYQSEGKFTPSFGMENMAVYGGDEILDSAAANVK
jgi:hypothetical protein